MRRDLCRHGKAAPKAASIQDPFNLLLTADEEGSRGSHHQAENLAISLLVSIAYLNQRPARTHHVPSIVLAWFGSHGRGEPLG